MSWQVSNWPRSRRPRRCTEITRAAPRASRMEGCRSQLSPALLLTAVGVSGILDCGWVIESKVRWRRLGMDGTESGQLTRTRAWFVLAFGVVVVLALSSAPAPADDEQIDRLVRQLGSDRFRDREAAGRALELIGEAAWEPLRTAAATSTDPEVR